MPKRECEDQRPAGDRHVRNGTFVVPARGLSMKDAAAFSAAAIEKAR